jgi:copper chaperone CopZ
MAGTDTVYNPVSSVEKNIEFADGSNSVDVTFEDNTTNSVFEYQSTRYVSAAVKESGTVKFFQDNRAIPGCTAIKAGTGRPATCIWKPSTLGSTSVTAVLTPSNTANPQRTSQPAIATIIPKS